MSEQLSNKPDDNGPVSTSRDEIHRLSLQILQYAHKEGSISDFLKRSTRVLMDYSGCDMISICIDDFPVNCCGEAVRKTEESFTFNTTKPGNKKVGKANKHTEVVNPLIEKMLAGNVGTYSRFITARGSFWTGDLRDFNDKFIHNDQDLKDYYTDHLAEYMSLALIPVKADGRTIGHMQMKSKQAHFFKIDDIEFHERIGEIIGAALVSQKVQMALGERIKELSCLYNIAQIAADPGHTLDEVIKNVAGLLPPAWQFPEIAEGRIILDGQIYATKDYRENLQSQSSDIIIKGKSRGQVEVAYTEPMPELDEGPFLREERHLIDAISRLIAQIIERKQAEEDRIKLQDQLRHADRLATIGQLAAGVAHEFNEPLGNILGFAQLIQKNKNMPVEIKDDIGKIVTASIHAREVVRKLMLFARQLPPERSRVNLNNVIEEGLYFLDARCSKAGIELVRSLTPGLPDILADQSQMYQVLVNLVVNAIQAMPDGGTIKIITKRHGKSVILKVSDNGTGMSDEVRKQLFIPFFTTKEVNEGTGLGLPVVHGIVTSHGGTIKVHSKPGEGSSFEISFPNKGPVNVEGSVNDKAD